MWVKKVVLVVVLGLLLPGWGSCYDIQGDLGVKGNADVTGNITVGGTVDGVDVAVAGSKLAGIEAGAQVNVGTNISWTAGAASGPTCNSSTGTDSAIPVASATASGVVTTGTQTFAGTKTFSSTISGSIGGNAATATRATNLSGGSAGYIPYQSAANTTTMLAPGTSGHYLRSNGATAPSWEAVSGGSATFLGLSDTPSSFSGKKGNYPVVNNAETALEFMPMVPVDIRQFGATCNGTTNDVAAIKAAVAAGYKYIFCPYNTYILLNSSPWYNFIPGGLTIYGEDWEHVVFKSTNVSSTNITVGAGTELNNVAFYHGWGEGIKNNIPGGVNAPLPVRRFWNSTPNTETPTNWYKQAIVVEQGDATASNGTCDRPAIAVGNAGEGDSFWTGVRGTTATTTGGVGYRADIMKGVGYYGVMGALGNVASYSKAIHLTSSSAYTVDAAAKLMEISAGTDNMSLFIQPNVATTTDVYMNSTTKTTGQMLFLSQNSSTFNGTGIKMDFALGSGSFGGDFVEYKKNGVTKFTVSHDGTATACSLVDSSTCDFVLEPGYPLVELDDMAEYIKENTRLPGLTRPEGISMGELYVKVEEQALYILQLHERLKKLEELVLAK